MGRFFTGVGAWGNMLSAITYQQEISPTSVRGALGGSVGIALMIGYATAGWYVYLLLLYRLDLISVKGWSGLLLRNYN
jgi:hypothetical protein